MDYLENVRAKQKLYNVPVSKPCQYIMHPNGAVIIEVLNESHPRGTNGCIDSEQSASMVNKRTEMMRVSVGDFDKNHGLLLGWSSGILSKSGKSGFFSMGRDAFMQTGVEMYNPEIVGTKHTFGTSELLAVFLQPYLYNPIDLLEKLNAQTRNAANVPPSLNAIKQLYLNPLTWGTKKQEKMEAYINAKGAANKTALEQELLKLELHPFFDIRADKEEPTSNIVVFTAISRAHYAGIPDYVIDKSVHIYRGNQLLANAGAEAAFIDLNKDLEGLMKLATDEVSRLKNADTFILYDPNATQDSDIRKAFKLVASGLIKVLENLYPHVANLEKITPICTVDKIINVILAQLVTGVKAVFTENDGAIKAGAKRVPWGDMLKNSMLPVTNGFTSANLYEIALSSEIPMILRAATMLMMTVSLTPFAMKESLQSLVHPGFSVDFLKKEQFYSDDIMYTKPRSMDMIVCPGPFKMEKDAGGSIECEIPVQIRTTSNTYAGAAVIATCAFPNTKGGSLATTDDGRPRIAIDYITRSKFGSVGEWAETTKRQKKLKRYKDILKSVSEDDVDIVTTALDEHDRLRLETSYKGRTSRAEDKGDVNISTITTGLPS